MTRPGDADGTVFRCRKANGRDHVVDGGWTDHLRDPNGIERRMDVVQDDPGRGVSSATAFDMPVPYFAYSTARVSRMTVTLIWPG